MFKFKPSKTIIRPRFFYFMSYKIFFKLRTVGRKKEEKKV